MFVKGTQEGIVSFLFLNIGIYIIGKFCGRFMIEFFKNQFTRAIVIQGKTKLNKVNQLTVPVAV